MTLEREHVLLMGQTGIFELYTDLYSLINRGTFGEVRSPYRRDGLS